MSKFKQLLIAFAIVGTVVGFIGLRLWNWVKPVASQTTEVQTLTAESYVVARVAGHISVPNGIPEVTKLAEVEVLKHQNPTFYGQAAPGDWVVRYPSFVVLYRLETNKVLTLLPLAPPVGPR